MLFWLVLLFGVSCIYCNESDGRTLELAHVIFRHGARTPNSDEFYPNNPYTVKDYSPPEYGQLTRKGKQQAYLLGTLLRERYSAILNETYTSDLILVKTTNFDRTKMTALAVLAALFPPTPSNTWNSNINWQPIPYHHDVFDYDLTSPTPYCPAYKRELEAEEASDVSKEIIRNYTATFEYLSNHTGHEIKHPYDALLLFYVLNTEENMNLTLPDWVNLVYPDTLRELCNLRFDLLSKTALMKRLNGGRILKIITKNMVEKSLGTLNPAGRKMYLYSAHDGTVASVFSALNIFTPHSPDYCSALAIELHRSDSSNQHYIKVVYLKNSYDKFQELTLPGCSSFCPLEKFLELTAQYLPGNYTEECESNVLLN